MNKAKEVFTDPKLFKRAEKIRKGFDEANADGVHLYNQMKEVLLEQQALNFERETAGYPYGMSSGIDGRHVDADLETLIMQWLNARMHPQEFLIFPINAGGKYKDRWNWIYFRKLSHAALFKLTWFDYL